MNRTVTFGARWLALFSLVRGLAILLFDQPQLGLAVFAFTHHVPTSFWGVWEFLTGAGLFSCTFWRAPSRLWNALLYANIGHWVLLSMMLSLANLHELPGLSAGVIAMFGMSLIYEKARGRAVRKFEHDAAGI